MVVVEIVKRIKLKLFVNAKQRKCNYDAMLIWKDGIY